MARTIDQAEHDFLGHLVCMLKGMPGDESGAQWRSLHRLFGAAYRRESDAAAIAEIQRLATAPLGPVPVQQRAEDDLNAAAVAAVREALLPVFGAVELFELGARVVELREAAMMGMGTWIVGRSPR